MTQINRSINQLIFIVIHLIYEINRIITIIDNLIKWRQKYNQFLDSTNH